MEGENKHCDFVLFLWIAAGGLLQVAAYSLFRWQSPSRRAAGFINHDVCATMLHSQPEEESFTLKLNFLAINTCHDSARNCWDCDANGKRWSNLGLMVLMDRIIACSLEWLRYVGLVSHNVFLQFHDACQMCYYSLKTISFPFIPAHIYIFLVPAWPVM